MDLEEVKYFIKRTQNHMHSLDSSYAHALLSRQKELETKEELQKEVAQ